jgi:hypothetical protein
MSVAINLGRIDEFGNKQLKVMALTPNFLQAIKEEAMVLTPSEAKKHLKESKKLLAGFSKILAKSKHLSNNLVYGVTAVPTSGSLLHEIREKSFKYVHPEQLLPPELVSFFQMIPDYIQWGGIILVVIMVLYAVILILLGKQNKAKDIIERSVKGFILLLAIPTVLYTIFLGIGFILGFDNITWLLKH